MRAFASSGMPVAELDQDNAAQNVMATTAYLDANGLSTASSMTRALEAHWRELHVTHPDAPLPAHGFMRMEWPQKSHCLREDICVCANTPGGRRLWRTRNKFYDVLTQAVPRRDMERHASLVARRLVA